MSGEATDVRRFAGNYCRFTGRILCAQCAEHRCDEDFVSVWTTSRYLNEPPFCDNCGRPLSVVVLAAESMVAEAV